MLTTDTTAVDTDTDTDMVSVIAVDTTDMADTPMPDMVVMLITTAKGRLMPLLMLTMDTTAVDTDTDTDTVMAVVTMVMADTVDTVDTDMVDTAVTTVRFNRILACRSKNLFHNYIHPATNNNF